MADIATEGTIEITTLSSVRAMVGRRLEVLRRLGEPDNSVNEYMLEIALWVLGWTLLFYILAWTAPMWIRSYAPSSKDYENNRYWLARQVLGIIHAILVCLLVIPGVCSMVIAPSSIQFYWSDDIVQCKMSMSPLAEVIPTDLYFSHLYSCIALAGLAFTTFTLSDVIVSLVHRKEISADAVLFVHHAVFVAAGLIIRSNCMMPFNAALLMAMEVSTPFLNYLFLVRHRGDAHKSATVLSGVLFFITYILFRLILNTYGTIVLWVNAVLVLLGQRRDTIMPSTVPSWQVWFLLVSVTAGSAVQFVWFPGIFQLFMKNYRAAFGSALDKNGDSDTNGGYEHLGDKAKSNS